MNLSDRTLKILDFEPGPQFWLHTEHQVRAYTEQALNTNVFFEPHTEVVSSLLLDKHTGRIVNGIFTKGLWGRLTAIALSHQLMSNQRKAARRFKLRRLALRSLNYRRSH